MPFTFSHAAVILPLNYFRPKWFSFTGLIIGSMAPDFLYFIKMDGNEDFGHTLTGIFLFDLPFSFLLAIAFHRWVRNPFLVHLPAPLNRRYPGYLAFDFTGSLQRSWSVFAFSAILGAVSHLAWDNFCSPRGWLFYATPSFFGQYISVGGGKLRLYVLIERIGSVLGLVLLAYAAIRAAMPAAGVPASGRSKVVYWLSLLVITLFFTAIKFTIDPQIDQLEHIVLILTSAACYAVGFVAALYAWLWGPPAHK
jgi:hypothetical protein